MAKRVTLYNDGNSIKIWANDIETLLAQGYKLQQAKKSTISSKKKDVEVEEQQQTNEGVNEWQPTSEQAE